MADTVKVVGQKDHVLEGGSLPVTVYFRLAGAADTPADVYYRVHCLTTNQEVTPWTSVSPDSSVSLTLSGANTDMKDPSNNYERKQLQIKADVDASDEVRGQWVYRVENLRGTE